MIARGLPEGIEYLLTPVNIVRYFEFPFALSCLPTQPGRWLDVSSPRLFSLFVATGLPEASIRAINPDVRDAARTARIAARLRITNVEVDPLGVSALHTTKNRFNCIWSLSVVEHIAGDLDDRVAVRLMFEALEYGGRLILTVPVDRQPREEYRDHDPYGTQPRVRSGYFFQRVYDEASIWERLISATASEPTIMRWFGETSPGRLAEYERRWLREGHRLSVHDPREIADNYREFRSWENMPGMGVCGLMIEKREE
jgi:hypothetical protein